MIHALLLTLRVVTTYGGITMGIVDIVLEEFPLTLACMMKDTIASLFATYILWVHVVNSATNGTRPPRTKHFRGFRGIRGHIGLILTQDG
jgi:hypothetical protein